MNLRASLLFLLPLTGAIADPPDTRLRYTTPAASWNEGLPVGNGRLGAMDLGGTTHERLQLNEGTLTSGEPASDLRSISIQSDLGSVRAMIAAGHSAEADAYIAAHWLGRCQQCYQPLGDLDIEAESAGPVSDYHRVLNLDTAVAATQWKQGGVGYTREVFASFPDQVIVVRLTATAAAALNLSVRLKSPHPTARTAALGSEGIEMTGQIPGFVLRRALSEVEAKHEQARYPEIYDAQGRRKPHAKQVLYADEIGGRGMYFDSRLAVRTTGGSVTTSPDGTCRVSHATVVILIFSAGSSFNGFDRSPSRDGVDPKVATAARLQAATEKTFAQLIERHEADYRALFNRSILTLPSSPEQRETPTDARLAAFSTVADPGLAALLYDFGRYLMIAGSRPGGQPTNLQGLWNDQVTPPWCSSYTVNINTEMNYWPAEVTSLPELAEPLFRMIRETAVTGAGTAQHMYGDRGWVSHHNITLWRDSYPVDGNTRASFWNMSGGWLCSHLWEHYLFTGDRAFLADQAYPVMKGAAEFYSDWLVRADGAWVTPVSTSPENAFVGPDGKRASASTGSTMDMTIIRELFTRTIAAAALLHRDEPLRRELAAKLTGLSPFKIGARGQLQEWREDYPEVEIHHRHMSHLYGLFPGNQITPDATPELFAAARRSLELRGDEATGWAMTWRIALWARELDGDHAYRVMQNFFHLVKATKEGNHGGGLYPSLLDACPPFQIDGNYGYTAAVAEMLVQSHAGFIQLLPAIPAVWSEGSVTGLKARGGFSLDLNWAGGTLTSATIHSALGGLCRIRSARPLKLSGGTARPASGPNPNPFFAGVAAGTPTISKNARLTLAGLPRASTIDVMTEPGQTLTVSSE
jgi:alpha-L-fucosidase 2